MDIREMKEKAFVFKDTLRANKAEIAPDIFSCYPYGTLGNFSHLDALLTDENRILSKLAGGGPEADIGSADGDMAFSLESLGFEMDILDYAPTNYNGLQGA